MADELPVFQTIERSKVYAAAVEQILMSIRSGQFPPGSALPPERALAAQLGVSRGSLREALRVLEHAGVLDARAGSGTYVAHGGDSTEMSVRAHAAVTGEHSPLDLIVARAAIEPVCAELAARVRSEGDLSAIRRCVDDQQRYVADGLDEQAAEADRQFHLAVAVASHNAVLEGMEQRIVGLMREDAWSRLKARARFASGPRFLEHHRLVLGAIEQGDARRAALLMQMHITAIEASFIADLEH